MFIYAIPVINHPIRSQINESFTQPIAVLFDQFNIQVRWFPLDLMDTKSLLFLFEQSKLRSAHMTVGMVATHVCIHSSRLKWSIILNVILLLSI